MSSSESSTYFSVRGLIAAAIAAFLCYQLFILTKAIQAAESRYDDNVFFRWLVEEIKHSSNKGPDYVTAAYKNLKSFIYLLFISYIGKFIVSLKHSFFNSDSNERYVFYLFLFEAVMFGLLMDFETKGDYFRFLLFLGIPSFIIYGLLDE